MKLLALYLPQFHQIPENDEWWGEGFTEWTNIKKENKYSDGLKPLNDNYYNLLEKDTMIWQNELATKHGVYGFCFYHYYFKGKKLLERPAENLLKWKDIPQNFCFQWANHSWKRSWQGSQEILLDQTYGNKQDWQDHFDYLKDFFLDERYIKIDNKPVFITFFNDFECKSDMIDFFDIECKKIGFDGIYFVENIPTPSYLDNVSINSNALCLREPTFSNSYKRSFFARVIYKIKKTLKIMMTFSAKTIMQKQLDNLNQNQFDKPIFLGAFAMWDNTYRHGKRGYKINPAKIDFFEYYLQQLKEYGEKNNVEYILYNAWNEWAEGMTLEPSNLYGNTYLERINKVFGEDSK